jgi:dihydroorotase
MTILARKALIIDPRSSHHNSVKDIFIAGGIIKEIGNDLSVQADEVIEAKDMIVSPGWIDLFAHFNDPGNEQKETLGSGANAAAAGGFTKVCVIPNTNPVTDAKSQVEYIVQKAKDLPISIYPLGAITKKTEGKELAEMYDMRNSGAVAFSDGTSPVQSSGLMLKALQYVKAFDGVLVQLPNDKSISAHGLMNEGIVSTRLGLPGIPAIAEELLIKRDIDLVRYTGSRIHFTGISTAISIGLVRAAKAEGLHVTCSATPYHLVFSEEDLLQYDTNLKVSPPLRTLKDVEALRQAVVNGDIDCIATHHFPQHIDNKVCEFEYAKDGMIGLESAFGLLGTAIPQLSPARTVELLHGNPAAILKLDTSSIENNATADLTIFSRNTPYTFGTQHIRSRSANTAVTGMQLGGKVIGIINKGKLFLN